MATDKKSKNKKQVKLSSKKSSSTEDLFESGYKPRKHITTIEEAREFAKKNPEGFASRYIEIAGYIPENTPLNVKRYYQIEPTDYTDPFNIARVIKNKPRDLSDTMMTPTDEEGWKQFLNLNKYPKNILPSKERPSKSKSKNTSYYRLNDVTEKQLFNTIMKQLQDSPDVNKVVSEFDMQDKLGANPYSVLGNFTIGRGKDPVTGKQYVSYYDKYDFDSAPEFMEKELNKAGTPFEFYNRFYPPTVTDEFGDSLDYGSPMYMHYYNKSQNTNNSKKAQGGYLNTNKGKEFAEDRTKRGYYYYLGESNKSKLLDSFALKKSRKTPYAKGGWLNKYAVGGEIEDNNEKDNASVITPFYKDAEDRKKYQEALTALWYGELNKNQGSVLPYLAKDRTKIIDPLSGEYVTNDQNTCIDGVCGIMEKAGKTWNAGNVNKHYIGNETFYDAVYGSYDKKTGKKSQPLEDAYEATGNFQVGDIIQTGYNTGKRFTPRDAKVIVAIEKDNLGNNIYHTSGGSGGESLGGSSYSDNELKNGIKLGTKTVTRPGYQLDKDRLKEERIFTSMSPEAKEAYINRKKAFDYAANEGYVPYEYSVKKGSKDIDENNPYVKEFLNFSNNSEKVKRLAEKLNVSVADVHDELLNTFGELGQESKFGTSISPETIFENIFKPAGKSIGPGQIRFNALAPDLKEKFDIQSPSDLYNEEKLIPLMTAMNLRNRQYLKNKGEKLSEDLMGVPGVNWKNIKSGIGRWTPYAYQASRIDNPKNYAKRKLQENMWFGEPTDAEVEEYYKKNPRYFQRILDPTSYPSQVMDYINNNLSRKILKNISKESGAVFNLPEIEIKPKDSNSSNKKANGGWLDNYSNDSYMFANGGKFITVDGEYHRVYENKDGDIVVNHPKEDKGKWDTINLTDKANAKTIADGVKSVKKWHKENPETKAKGGWLNKYM